MALYRSTRKDCFNCGAQIPNEVEVEQSGSFERYLCPKCLDVVLNGIVQKRNRVRETRISPPNFVPDDVLTIGDEVDFHQWELWWIQNTYVVTLNGYPVAGNEAFLEYVSSILSL